MYSQNYKLGKAWLDRYLKSPFSEGSSRSNIGVGPKNC